VLRQPGLSDDLGERSAFQITGVDGDQGTAFADGVSLMQMASGLMQFLEPRP
jgi:hypothetical protein